MAQSMKVMSISTLQFMKCAMAHGIITPAEATAMAIGGEAPSFMLPVISALSTTEQAVLKITLARMTALPRQDSFVQAAQALLGWNDDQMDDFFYEAAQL